LVIAFVFEGEVHQFIYIERTMGKYLAVTVRLLSHVLREAALLEPKQLIGSVLTVSFNVLTRKAENKAAQSVRHFFSIPLN
jgi:hypothetical protein